MSDSFSSLTLALSYRLSVYYLACILIILM
jgi:hypothetical protein